MEVRQGHLGCRGGALFSVIKRQFRYIKVNYRGLKKHCTVVDAVYAIESVVKAKAVDARRGDRAL